MDYRKYFKIIAIGFLLIGCEGSFDANPITEGDILNRIDLTAPPNEDVCLTEGLDSDGNWMVNFEWSTDVPYEGSFILTRTADGNTTIEQNVDSGTSLTLQPNTVYQWQVSDQDQTVTSDTFTFVTPAARDEGGMAPPAISAIRVEPNGGDFTVSYTVMDSDGDLVGSVLSVNGTPQDFGTQMDVSTTVSLSLGQVNTLRVVANDQADNETSTERTYTVQ